MERERLSYTIHYTDHEKQKKKEREKEETSYQVVREIHIKTASRFHPTPDRTVKIKESSDSNCCPRCGEWEWASFTVGEIVSLCSPYGNQFESFLQS